MEEVLILPHSMNTREALLMLNNKTIRSGSTPHPSTFHTISQGSQEEGVSPDPDQMTKKIHVNKPFFFRDYQYQAFLVCVKGHGWTFIAYFCRLTVRRMALVRASALLSVSACENHGMLHRVPLARPGASTYELASNPSKILR